MATIIAKNQAAAALALDNIGATDQEIPPMVSGVPGTVTLSDFNTTWEIQQDTQLRGYVDAGNVVINNGTVDLTLAQAQTLLEPDGAKVDGFDSAGLDCSMLPGKWTLVASGITVIATGTSASMGTFTYTNGEMYFPLAFFREAPAASVGMNWSGTNSSTADKLLMKTKKLTSGDVQYMIRQNSGSDKTVDWKFYRIT